MGVTDMGIPLLNLVPAAPHASACDSGESDAHWNLPGQLSKPIPVCDPGRRNSPPMNQVWPTGSADVLAGFVGRGL